MRHLNISSSLDEYYDFISKRGLRIAIIVRDDELPFLKEGSNHWIFSFGVPLLIFRATLNDFETLEIGTHPKVIVYRNGSELENFNGIPSFRKLKAALK
jgi:hypothetical protein